MIVTIQELEILFKLVINKLKKDRLTAIKFDIDEYWIITTDQWDSLEEIPNPVLSSLKEDVEYLKRTIVDNEIFTYSDFDRLASVLRLISERQAPINSNDASDS